MGIGRLFPGFGCAGFTRPGKAWMNNPVALSLTAGFGSWSLCPVISDCHP